MSDGMGQSNSTFRIAKCRSRSEVDAWVADVRRRMAGARRQYLEELQYRKTMLLDLLEEVRTFAGPLLEEEVSWQLADVEEALRRWSANAPPAPELLPTPEFSDTSLPAIGLLPGVRETPLPSEPLPKIIEPPVTASTNGPGIGEGTAPAQEIAPSSSLVEDGKIVSLRSQADKVWNELPDCLQEREEDDASAVRLRVRSLLCQLRALRKEAEEKQCLTHIPTLLDLGAEAEKRLRGRVEDWDDPPLHTKELPFTAEQWADLSDGYKRMAQAYPALQWLERHFEWLEHEEKRALLDAIGAAQQLVGRRVMAHFFERDQREIYERIKGLLDKSQNIYLQSLRRMDSQQEEREELRRLADRLDHAWEIARRSAPERERVYREQQAREAQKATERARAKETEQRRIAVHELLREATQSHAIDQVREALRFVKQEGQSSSQKEEADEWLIPFITDLKTEKEFEPFVTRVEKRIAQKEREEELRKLQTQDEEEDNTPASTEELRRVLSVTRGKTGVIIGGEPNPRVVERIEELLELQELKRVKSRPQQSFSRYESQLRRADLVLVLTHYTDDKLKAGIRKLAREPGCLAVFMPGGYSPNQVVHEIFEELVAHDGNYRKT